MAQAPAFKLTLSTTVAMTKYPGFHNGLGVTSKGPYFQSMMCRSCKYFINSAYINCTPFPKGPTEVQNCPSYVKVKEGEAQGRQWIVPTHTVQTEEESADDHGYAEWPDDDPHLRAIARSGVLAHPGSRYPSGCQVVRTCNTRDIVPPLPPIDEHVRAAYMRYGAPTVMYPKLNYTLPVELRGSEES